MVQCAQAPSGGLMLERVTGPECPTCGCSDSELLTKASWWGQPSERRRCAHCGKVFTATAAGDAEDGRAGFAGVTYHVVRCPACRSDETRVTSTRRPLRYHKCDRCGHSFKSTEG